MNRGPTLDWSPYQPLREAWLGDRLPKTGGLYRIRRVGFAGIDYIGQTGSGSMNLKKRMSMLRGVWADEMPYRDPHTAGPGLWALRSRDRCDFEVSVSVHDGTTADRKSLECLAIAQYRQDHGSSPTLNFGRMPTGYRMSSANNRRLVEAGRRFRGGPSAETDATHTPSRAPTGPLNGSVTDEYWCGLSWSPWMPVDAVREALDRDAVGFYRLAGPKAERLAYVGEGKIVQRIANHVAKTRQQGHKQGQVLADFSPIRASFCTTSDWQASERLEIENDLIAAHVMRVGYAPNAQFLG